MISLSATVLQMIFFLFCFFWWGYCTTLLPNAINVCLHLKSQLLSLIIPPLTPLPEMLGHPGMRNTNEMWHFQLCCGDWMIHVMWRASVSTRRLKPTWLSHMQHKHTHMNISMSISLHEQARELNRQSLSLLHLDRHERGCLCRVPW